MKFRVLKRINESFPKQDINEASNAVKKAFSDKLIFGYNPPGQGDKYKEELDYIKTKKRGKYIAHHIIGNHVGERIVFIPEELHNIFHEFISNELEKDFTFQDGPLNKYTYKNYLNLIADIQQIDLRTEKVLKNPIIKNSNKVSDAISNLRMILESFVPYEVYLSYEDAVYKKEKLCIDYMERILSNNNVPAKFKKYVGKVFTLEDIRSQMQKDKETKIDNENEVENQ